MSPKGRITSAVRRTRNTQEMKAEESIVTAVVRPAKQQPKPRQKVAFPLWCSAYLHPTDSRLPAAHLVSLLTPPCSPVCRLFRPTVFVVSSPHPCELSGPPLQPSASHAASHILAPANARQMRRPAASITYDWRKATAPACPRTAMNRRLRLEGFWNNSMAGRNPTQSLAGVENSPLSNHTPISHSTQSRTGL